MSHDDPRLVALYDIDNPDGPDHDFFRRRAAELGARRIIDLGCGTGILTVTLASPVRTVTGIDPSPAMLACATGRPGGDKVSWVRGTAEQLVAGSADLVVMSGNVAMHILGDAWHQALASIADALVPGGRLLFESRNPQARAWEHWTEPMSERDTPQGRLRESVVTDPADADGVVTMHCHNEFIDRAEVIEVDQHLQFRSRERIEADLSAAGLDVAAVWRDWYQHRFTGGSEQPLMVFEATRS